MVDWTSPEEIKFERGRSISFIDLNTAQFELFLDILVKVIHVLAGIYL